MDMFFYCRKMGELGFAQTRLHFGIMQRTEESCKFEVNRTIFMTPDQPDDVKEWPVENRTIVL